MLDELADWIEQVISALGYPGLAWVMFLETVFPPIPSEIVLPLAGSLTIDGPYNLLAVAGVGSVGSLAGAWVFYGLGRWIDRRRFGALVNRYGAWFLITEADWARAVDWFDRYGEIVVFVGRMVPLVRSLISIPAGMAHMNVLRFTLYTALGSFLWSLALAFAGRLLGQGWSTVSAIVGRYQDATVAFLGLAVVAFFATRVYGRLTRH